MPLSPLPIELASRIQITTGDITRVTVDAIVNAANTSLLGGGGVDGAIHRTGGPEILEDCRKIVARQGGCKTGEAVITRAGNLSAKYVIHTVGPVWNGGAKSEHELLRNCYRNTLELAAAHACISVAFPAISTGIYRFPKSDAAQIALQTTLAFLESHSFPKTVNFVCFDEENTRIMTECLQNL